jgi:hypothetical protein
MAATPEFSWITLFAGLGVGSIIAALVGRWSAKAVTISNHRQNWINALREDIVAFLQAVDKIQHSANMAKGGSPSLPEKSSDLEAAHEARNSALLVYRRILLRLNMIEKPHIELGERLKELLTVKGATSDTQKIDAIVMLSREILKHEWAVAKYGIFTGPVTYLKGAWRRYRVRLFAASVARIE